MLQRGVLILVKTPKFSAFLSLSNPSLILLLAFARFAFGDIRILRSSAIAKLSCHGYNFYFLHRFVSILIVGICEGL